MKITDLIQTERPYGRTVSELHIDIEVEESAPTEIIVTRRVGDKRHVYTYVNLKNMETVMNRLWKL